MKYFSLLFLGIFLLIPATMCGQQAGKKGSFGIAIKDSFIKFNYVISYLGKGYKEGNYAFRIDFEDNKGYNMANEIDESQSMLKNIKNQTIRGKIEKISEKSAVFLFPNDDKIEMKGKTRLYTVIKGYKLLKDFEI